MPGSRFGCDDRDKFGVSYINLMMNFSLKSSGGKAPKWSCFEARGDVFDSISQAWECGLGAVPDSLFSS